MKKNADQDSGILSSYNTCKVIALKSTKDSEGEAKEIYQLKKDEVGGEEQLHR